MWTCPNCKNENELSFCSVCGAPQQSAPAPQKKKRGFIVACCILGCIGILLIILLLLLIFGEDTFTISNPQAMTKRTPAATAAVSAPAATPSSTALPTPAPISSRILMDADREKFLEIVRKNLGVPDNLSVTAEVGELAYWEGIGTHIVHVSFYHNGKTVAAASVYPDTGELARSILMYTAPSEAPASVTYKSLHNSRFGFSIAYPSFFTQVRHAQNSAGTSLSTSDGTVRMQVFGDHMAEFGTTPTLMELYEAYKRQASYDIGYETKKNNWFVLSGELDGMVFYEKHFLKSDGTHNWFVIEYPKSREKEFDPIIEHLVETFRTGTGADSPAAN